MLATILFYDVVVAVHIASVMIAFGVTFAYGMIMPWVTRTEISAVPLAHRMQVHLNRRLTTPVMVLLLITGIYLAADRDLFKQPWVSVPMVIILILFGLVGAFFIPQDQKLADLAERDLAAGDTLSDEYAAGAKRSAIVGTIAGVLILTAIFFMVVKPFPM